MDHLLLHATAFRFEVLVRQIFEAHQMRVVVNVTGADAGADFAIELGASAAVVEVKLYSSMKPPTANISKALDRLERARRLTQAPFGILATNSRLSEMQRSYLERYPNLRIFDFDVLAALAARKPELVLELENINRTVLVFRGEDLPIAETVDAAPLLEEIGASGDNIPSEPTITSPEPPGRGAELCQEIHDVAKSKGKPFEVACEAAIRYLFEHELVAFDDQHESHTGQHYFDLVARIASKVDFWQALITDFRARYIVFEFKNYQKEITQREIYTTEKYLYPVAMRGAAIIVSRHGADEGADKAMRGALREGGKLILSLSVEELCGMLHARDAGSDHLATLVSKLDLMLMGLER